jgi:spore coat assemly protein
MVFKIGDLVTRIKYGDIIFQLRKIYHDEKGKYNAILLAKDSRLVVNAPLTDLKSVSQDLLFRNLDEQHSIAMRNLQGRSIGDLVEENKTKGFKKRIKVLHLDGEKTYIKICQEVYNKAGLINVSASIPPQEQAKVVRELLIRERPDILVLTGHDALRRGQDPRRMESYWFSKEYVEAVKVARDYARDIDDLVIVAGACQSYFEALIEAGANFASSPSRINIYPSEPALMVALLASEPVSKYLNYGAIEGTLPNGIKGTGGVQTKGKLRIGGPKIDNLVNS